MDALKIKWQNCLLMMIPSARVVFFPIDWIFHVQAPWTISEDNFGWFWLSRGILGWRLNWQLLLIDYSWDSIFPFFRLALKYLGHLYKRGNINCFDFMINVGTSVLAEYSHRPSSNPAISYSSRLEHSSFDEIIHCIVPKILIRDCICADSLIRHHAFDRRGLLLLG